MFYFSQLKLNIQSAMATTTFFSKHHGMLILIKADSENAIWWKPNLNIPGNNIIL